MASLPGPASRQCVILRGATSHSNLVYPAVPPWSPASGVHRDHALRCRTSGSCRLHCRSPWAPGLSRARPQLKLAGGLRIKLDEHKRSGGRQVRTRLTAGGNRLRTIGAAEALGIVVVSVLVRADF